MKSLIFSKDRPMQLDACIASMLHYGRLSEEDVFVQFKYCPEYDITIKRYPNVNWCKESNFDQDLKHLVNNKIDENVLMCVDDAVFFNYFDPSYIETLLTATKQIIGFSLRLGENVRKKKLKDSPNDISTWKWKKRKSHHGYPFDVSASVYPIELIRNIVNNGKYKIPNDLEGCGDRYCRIHDVPEYFASYNISRAACQDINRVQNRVPNKINGTKDHSPLSLKKKYKDGFRIDWKSMYNIVPDDCFIGYKYFKMRKENKDCSASIS